MGNMETTLEEAREHFIQGLSHISQFWGFPKAMGAIYAVLYLSAEPLSLDEIVAQVRVTKGAVSTNVRNLERLGMVHPHIVVGERKDYYAAEPDFWKIVRNVLNERGKSEFDQAIRAVGESRAMLAGADLDPEDAGRALFYQLRLQSMEAFFHTLDHLVTTVLAVDDLRSGTIERLLGPRDHPPLA
jgi:HTH-type transcriptional regulator, glycine betaine synthesis regulator